MNRSQPQLDRFAKTRIRQKVKRLAMRFRLNRHEREDIKEELEGRVLRRLVSLNLDGPARRRLVAEIICEEAQDIDHSVYDAKWGNKQLFLENIADDCENFDHDEDNFDEYFAD